MWKGIEEKKLKCGISISFVELYNFDVLDLLSDRIKSREIKECVLRGGAYIDNVEEIRVSNKGELLKYFDLGIKAKLNAHSYDFSFPRDSSTFFTISFEQDCFDEGNNELTVISCQMSFINIVHVEKTRREIVFISRKYHQAHVLYVLNILFDALIRKQSKVKIDSTSQQLEAEQIQRAPLIRFLQGILGGNYCLHIVVNILPGLAYNEETCFTLKNGNRFRLLTKLPAINVLNYNDLIRERRVAVVKIKELLEDAEKQLNSLAEGEDPFEKQRSVRKAQYYYDTLLKQLEQLVFLSNHRRTGIMI
jgi:hypothetical protein